MRDEDNAIEGLGEAEARLAGILAIVADAIISIDEEQCIRLFNDGAMAIFGYERAEILGRPLSVLIPERFRSVHSDHVRQFGCGAVVSRSMDERREIYALRKDGSEFPAEAAISRLSSRGRLTFTVILRDISERKRAQDALARSNADLEQRVSARTAALSAEIKRREETQAQLIRTQRMEAFGQLTGGIAHDFNNLLTVISGNLELLDMRIEDEKSRVLLKRAQDASEMGARLTSRLLTFARRRKFNSAEINLNEQIAAMVELLRRTMGEHIDLTTRLVPQLWLLSADPSEIENVILNLVINARDAMPKGGTLVLETANVVLDDAQVGGETKLPAGEYVRLSVTDTGTGMSPDVAQRAFEPFFTTKPQGKGTGLGLSSVYGFVQSAGGGASLYSEPGLGTTVNLYLPRMKGTGQAFKPLDASEIRRGRGETVLVVEDNPDVRAVARQHLADLGYIVLEAETGPAAIDMLGSHPGTRVVFSDVVMPGGMSGLDVAREVRVRWPHIKVLLTSGYAEDAIKEQGGGAVDHRIIRKPYSKAELARAVADILAEAGTG